MAKLCHRLRAVQTRLALTQAITRDVELGLGAPPIAALLCLVERAGDCDGQAHEIVLEHIVGGAALQRPDRILFADRAGDEDERSVRRYFPGERERLHAIEARHRKIRKDHVRRELAQRGHKIVGMIDDPRCHTQSRALQLADLKLGVCGDVLRDQNPDCRRDHVLSMASNVELTLSLDECLSFYLFKMDK